MSKSKNNINFNKKHISAVVKSINIITKFLPIFSCFVKASCFKYIFKNEAIILNIGIRRENKKFVSHAWITKNETVMLNNDKNIDAYKVIYKL